MTTCILSNGTSSHSISFGWKIQVTIISFVLRSFSHWELQSRTKQCDTQTHVAPKYLFMFRQYQTLSRLFCTMVVIILLLALQSISARVVIDRSLLPERIGLEGLHTKVQIEEIECQRYKHDARWLKKHDTKTIQTRRCTTVRDSEGQQQIAYIKVGEWSIVDDVSFLRVKNTIKWRNGQVGWVWWVCLGDG